MYLWWSWFLVSLAAEAFVGKGYFKRRIAYHAKGRSGIIMKPECRLTVVVREITPEEEADIARLRVHNFKKLTKRERRLVPHQLIETTPVWGRKNKSSAQNLSAAPAWASLCFQVFMPHGIFCVIDYSSWPSHNMETVESFVWPLLQMIEVCAGSCSVLFSFSSLFLFLIGTKRDMPCSISSMNLLLFGVEV